MTNPLQTIEDAKAQSDIGVFAARVYAGALEETSSRRRAFWITVAWCLAMFKSTEEPGA
jgi:hypothetical protein